MRDIVHNRVSLKANEGGKDTLVMTRRRYQEGSVQKKNGNWTMRFREYVCDAQGIPRVIMRRRILLPANRPKSEARRMAAQIMAQGGYGSDSPRALLNFSEFWDTQFTPNVLSNLKPATQQLYRTLGKIHIDPAFGKRLITEITRLDVQRFINAKRDAGYATQTLAHLRNLLSKVFGCGVKWGFTTMNPASQIDLPHMVRKRQPRILKPEEISALAAALREPARTIFLTGALLGLRIGELLALQAGDVDLIANRLHIRRNIYRGKVGTPKTAAGIRVLPIPKALLSLLAFHRQGKGAEDWLFPNAAGAPYDDRNLIRREIKPPCRKLGIGLFSWHSLRHTFCTYSGNSRVAMPVLGSLVGHTSANVTMRYIHPQEEVQREAVEQLASELCPNLTKSALN